MGDRYDTLVVGAGFAGAVLAERLASRCGHRVLVVDRRDHIAGNAHDYVDAHGVRCHAYGPHIFHTNCDRVVEYLSRFTRWRGYEHRVLAEVDGRLLPIPINRATLNGLYGTDLATEADAKAFLALRAEPRPVLRNSEDTVVAKVGRELYEKFFRGYTRKQWGHDPSELHASVCGRIPVRFSADDRYFTDAFQQMPAAGYTAMIGRMLDHPRIDVRLRLEYDDVRDEIEHDHLVYTGPIDSFFGCVDGPLPYRSLEFELVNTPTPNGDLKQPVAQINQPREDVAHTRTTEFRHMTGQMHDSTTIAYEYPRAEGDPCYPIPRPENRELFKRYRAMADRLPDVTFVGRLASYQYLNMDQVTGQALATFDRILAAGRVPMACA